MPKLDPQADRHGHRRGPGHRAGQLGGRAGQGRQVPDRDAVARPAAQLRQRRGQHAGPAGRRHRRRAGHGGRDERRGEAAGRVPDARGHPVRARRAGPVHQRVRPGPDRPGLLRPRRLPPVRADPIRPDARPAGAEEGRLPDPEREQADLQLPRARWAARPASPSWPGTATSARPSATAAAWWSPCSAPRPARCAAGSRAPRCSTGASRCPRTPRWASSSTPDGADGAGTADAAGASAAAPAPAQRRPGRPPHVRRRRGRCRSGRPPRSPWCSPVRRCCCSSPSAAAGGSGAGPRTQPTYQR